MPGIAFDAVSTSGFFASTASSLSWNHTVTGTNTFMMIMGQTNSGGGGSFITGVTFDGVAMTQLIVVQESVNLDYEWYFYLPAPHTGTHSITVTAAFTGTHYGQFVGGSYTGVAQTNPIDASNSIHFGAGTGNSALTLTPNVTGDWFISGYDLSGPYSNNPLTADTSVRRIIDATGASTAIFDQSGGTLSNMTMTINPNCNASYQMILGALVKAAPTSQILKVSGVAQASISKVSSIANASIKKISGVANT